MGNGYLLLNLLHVFTLSAILTVAAGCSCSTNHRNTDKWLEVHPFESFDQITLRVPATYIKKDLWSPDSLVVIYKSQEDVSIFVEVGLQGDPDYSDRQNFIATPVNIDGREAEIISYIDNTRAHRDHFMKLRFLEPSAIGVWSYFSAEHYDDVNLILKSLNGFVMPEK